MNKSKIIDEYLNYFSHEYKVLYGLAKAHEGAEYKEIVKTAATAGALITALKKATKRDFIITIMLETLGKYDLTATAASQILKSITGHKCDINVVTERFGTPGRTAQNKSNFFENGLDPKDEKMLEETYGTFLKKLNYRHSELKKLKRIMR